MHIFKTATALQPRHLRPPARHRRVHPDMADLRAKFGADRPQTEHAARADLTKGFNFRGFRAIAPPPVILAT